MSPNLIDYHSNKFVPTSDRRFKFVPTSDCRQQAIAGSITHKWSHSIISGTLPTYWTNQLSFSKCTKAAWLHHTRRLLTWMSSQWLHLRNGWRQWKILAQLCWYNYNSSKRLWHLKMHGRMNFRVDFTDYNSKLYKLDNLPLLNIYSQLPWHLKTNGRHQFRVHFIIYVSRTIEIK